MFINHVALVSLTTQVTPADLAQLAAALQKQVARDLAPIWNVRATVNAFPDLSSVPVGYWPITITETISNPNDEGYHWSETSNLPFAVVKFDNAWQLTCSHELCEMLVDPSGNRTVTSDSIEPGQGRVNYLVEVCDPCQDAACAYPVNGILLADFYTPNYFDPVQNSSVRYSYTGAITKPRQVLKNGYLSWNDPAGAKWYQANFFQEALQVVELTTQVQGTGSLRGRVDRASPNPNKHTSFEAAHAKHVQKQAVFEKSAQAAQNRFMEEIKQFVKM